MALDHVIGELRMHRVATEAVRMEGGACSIQTPFKFLESLTTYENNHSMRNVCNDMK